MDDPDSHLCTMLGCSLHLPDCPNGNALIQNGTSKKGIKLAARGDHSVRTRSFLTVAAAGRSLTAIRSMRVIVKGTPRRR